MPGARRGSDCRGRPVARHERADRGAGLGEDHQRRGHVPQVDVQFDIGIGAPGRDVGQPERAGAAEPRHRARGDDAVGQRQEVVVRTPARPAQFDGGAVQRRWCRPRGSVRRSASRRRPARAAKVSSSAGATITPISGVSPSRQPSETQKRLPPRMKLAVPSIGSTTQRRLPERALPPSSPWKPSAGYACGQTFGEQTLDRAVGLGEPVLRALQRGRMRQAADASAAPARRPRSPARTAVSKRSASALIGSPRA